MYSQHMQMRTHVHIVFLWKAPGKECVHYQSAVAPAGLSLAPLVSIHLPLSVFSVLMLQRFISSFLLLSALRRELVCVRARFRGHVCASAGVSEWRPESASGIGIGGAAVEAEVDRPLRRAELSCWCGGVITPVSSSSFNQSNVPHPH